MPVCSACGQENVDVARFCLACGRPLAAEPGAPREERRLVSVIFVDLVGFTGRAEQLDPEDVRAVLRPYHDAVRAELESFGGVVEKFIGDAVVGVFGAPVASGDDAERAVRAALAVRETVARLSGDGGPELSLRIGVNTGEALVTLDARPALGESMVAGDVVNTAARLQAAAAPGGILVGEQTYLSTRDAIVYDRVPAVDAKGKQQPVPAWTVVAAAVEVGERPLVGALVGRASELEMLRGTWERVVEQRSPHLVTVIGPAGIGKTRLGVEFAQTVRELGGRVVRGRSLPYRDSTAYGALGFQLKQLCSIFESDSVEVALRKLRERTESLLGAADAATVGDHLAILLGLDTESVVGDRDSFFFSIRCFVDAIAQEQPTVLVFEDLHWGDSSLLDLVELLAAHLRELPLLILALARPDLLDVRPGWGGGIASYSSVRLGPLREDEATQLASNRLAELATSLAGERAARLAELANGNPLFIEQLAATVAETGSEAGASLPTTIRELISARLDALPANERAVLLNAAVVGKVFWRGAVEQTFEHGSESLSNALGALERRDLIRRETVSAIEGDSQYSFTHVLVRDVAYEFLPRARRQQLHQQAARFFEAATAERGEAGAAIARHLRAAGENARAAEYFSAAAEAAEKGWAKELAASLYREALALVPDSDPERRKALRRRLALAEQASYHLPDARLLKGGRVDG